MKHCPQCTTGYPDSHSTCPIHGVLLNEIRDLKPGMVIHHSYRIVRKLGEGGMGAVYLAQHTLMDEPRALKFLSPELSRDKAFTGRFLREVRTLRQTRNRNVVDCGDLESAEDGSLFFSMEYVDGPDLRDFLNNAPKPFDVQLALGLARGIAEGLGAAHAKGMVHRDIKPENILMARDGDALLPKIADFGIVATKESSTVYTRTGGTLLTMAYAAPEQWRGTPGAELDSRTDLYALGGVLYEMLTGRTPFEAENYEGWAWQHQNTPPQSPSSLRSDLADWQGLDALVLRLLAKDREERPKGVADLLGLLDAVVYVKPEARRETEIDGPAGRLGHNLAEKSPKTARRSGVWFGLLAGGIILAALAMWFISHRLEQPANSAGQATDTEKPAIARNQQNANPAQPGQPQQGQFPGPNRPTIKPSSTQEITPVPGPNNKPPASTPESPLTPKPAQVEPTKPATQENDAGDAEKQANILVGQHRYAEAAPLYEQACNDGLATDCFILARMYHNGDGVSRDEARAASLFTKGCDGGVADSCAALSYMYGTGTGVTKDPSRAVPFASKACDGGSMQGCYAAGVGYDFGIGVAEDFPRAAALYSKACSAGNKQSCGNLGQLYLTGKGVERDYSRATDLLTSGCDVGSGLNCYNLGLLYESGNGVAKDASRAAAMFSKACDTGNASGCGNLGHAYATGDGVTKDLFRAATYYSKACDAGIPMSCAQLGALYQQGNGVAKDYNQAQSLYSKACNAGYVGGCTGLGFIFYNGDGVAKDEVKAAGFFSKACDAGDANGCNSLGAIYQYGGKGVNKDKDKAKQLYSKSCSMGNQQACDLLKKLH